MHRAGVYLAPDAGCESDVHPEIPRRVVNFKSTTVSHIRSISGGRWYMYGLGIMTSKSKSLHKKENE